MSIIDVCNTRYTISEAWYAYQFTVACRILVRDSPNDGTKLKLCLKKKQKNRTALCLQKYSA